MCMILTVDTEELGKDILPVLRKAEIGKKQILRPRPYRVNYQKDYLNI